jgi:hypothetical protein
MVVGWAWRGGLKVVLTETHHMPGLSIAKWVAAHGPGLPGPLSAMANRSVVGVHVALSPVLRKEAEMLAAMHHMPAIGSTIIAAISTVVAILVLAWILDSKRGELSLWWETFAVLFAGGVASFLGWLWDDTLSTWVGKTSIGLKDSDPSTWTPLVTRATFLYAAATFVVGVAIVQGGRACKPQNGTPVQKRTFKLVARMVGYVMGWACSNAAQYFRDNLPIESVLARFVAFAALCTAIVCVAVIPILQWESNRAQAGLSIGYVNAKVVTELQLTAWSVIVGRAFKYALQRAFDDNMDAWNVQGYWQVGAAVLFMCLITLVIVSTLVALINVFNAIHHCCCHVVRAAEATVHKRTSTHHPPGDAAAATVGSQPHHRSSNAADLISYDP